MSSVRRELGLRFRIGAFLLGIACWGWASLGVQAQETPPETDPFESQSVAYRTALHYDPSLQAPLDQLIKMYREKGRMAELKAIYESHISQYPADAGAKAVLVRIYNVESDPKGKNLILQGIQQHPESAYLNFLHFELLDKESEPGAVQALSKAIELEQRPDRRLEWIEVLLQETTGTDERDVAETHLKELREVQQGNIGGLEALAEMMHRYGFPELGLETVGDALALNPAPENQVNLQMLGAKMDAALGNTVEAGERLSGLLEKVAPDYWRRSEIVSLRISLLNSDAARETLLQAAREKYEAQPESVEVVLDLVELLLATGLRKDAAEVLVESSERMPHSQPLEQKALEVLDRLGEDEQTLAYLDARLEQAPERIDLRYRMVQALYLVGDEAGAAAEFQTVCEGLTGDALMERRLDLARYLRRMNLADYAIPILESVIELAPKRLDLRRELAEAQLAVGNREGARRIVANWDDQGTSIEHFLEFVHLMVQQDFLSEAKEALERRVGQNPESLELRLLLADVLASFGDQRLGTLQLQEARDLADTTARYRQWLESAMRFHEDFDNTDAFFDSEQQRLLADSDEWTKEQIARFLALCEVGENNKQNERVAHLLRTQLAEGNLPPDLEVDVRRLLVKTLDEDPVYSLEVETQLRQLLEDDPEGAADYQLRLALLYHSNQRPDLAQPLLAEVNYETVGEPALLRSSQAALADYQMYFQMLTGMRRLVTLESGNRQHWEKLLNMLVAMDREVEFRQVVWRLLGGSKDLELTEESSKALRTHLADSYWRSISKALNDSRTGASEVMALLDSLERSVGGSEDQLWALWARAFLLNRMGQEQARDEVVQALLEQCQVTGKEAIAFPDGLAIQTGAAEQVLKEPPPVTVTEAGAGEPISEALSMGWGFEVDPGAVIIDIEPVGDQVLVLDNRLTIYGVHRTSGKLLWMKRTRKNPAGSSPSASSTVQNQLGSGVININGGIIVSQGGSITITQSSATSRTLMSQVRQHGQVTYPVDYYAPQTLRPLQLVGDGSQRFFVPEGHFLVCYDAASGDLVWSSPILLNSEARSSELKDVAEPLLEYALVGERIICFDPRTSMAASVEASSGKILWLKQIENSAEEEGRTIIRAALNSGAAFGAERMLVYGDRSAILDSRNGEVMWQFDGEIPHRFPLQLHSAEEESALAAMTYTPDQVPTSYVSHLTNASERGAQVDSFLKYDAALVAPAVEWASQHNQDGQARYAALQGRKMLLMGPKGIGVYSLDLPLAGRQYPITGIYLGGSTNRACVRTSETIEILDLTDGYVESLPLNAQPGERVETLVEGNRVYACSAQGLRCWNLHTGRRIFDVPWPAELAQYAQKHRGFQQQPGTTLYWQGIAESQVGSSNSARVCYPIRTEASGGQLYVLISDRVMAALTPRKAAGEG